ncbi:MAG: hypothetical protein JW993_04170 [Sedimentisphaerales bacterium]|nr:hypothetical protein [Sedimentisphaerales bacterium]
MEAFLKFAATIAPFVVLVNCILLALLMRKAERFEKAIGKYENRELLRLEKDTMEALTLLRTGKTEEAEGIAERMLNS